MMVRHKIKKIKILGDSLSDRGTTNNRKLWFIPMAWIAGLTGKSPEGSFTNGLPWSDHFLAEIANQFIIEKFENEKHLTSDDIADNVISQEREITIALDDYYNLKNDLTVKYRGHNFASTYTEGGLASYDYRWLPSWSLSRFITRLILPTLGDKRSDLLNQDKKNNESAEEKASTLIIEWSGANDLITVNAEPSKCVVKRAIAARMENVRQLIKAGYRHFILFNLPDLSFVPRFQVGFKADRENAHRWSVYFNAKLMKKCGELLMEFPHCSIDVFDANTEFLGMLEDPEKYRLDKSKLTIPYTQSKDFKMLRDGTSPAKGYAFWDDVHPTADVHALLAMKFWEKYQKHFEFIPPPIPHEHKGMRRIHSEEDLHRKEKCSGQRFFEKPKEDKEKISLGSVYKKSNK